MVDVESKSYQIWANILLAIGAILAIIGIVVDPNQANVSLLIVVFIVLVALGTRFSWIYLLLLGLADIAVFVRFFG